MNFAGTFTYELRVSDACATSNCPTYMPTQPNSVHGSSCVSSATSTRPTPKGGHRQLLPVRTGRLYSRKQLYKPVVAEIALRQTLSCYNNQYELFDPVETTHRRKRRQIELKDPQTGSTERLARYKCHKST